MPATKTMPETKVCRRCNRELPVTDFYTDRGTVRTKCKECDLAIAHETRQTGVPVAPFQARFAVLKQRGITEYEIARNAGWLDPRTGNPDTQRVMRTLGLKPYHDRGKVRWKKAIKPATARALAEAMHADPVDLGF